MFLEFVKADLKDCMNDFEDEFILRIQNTICRIKDSREMEERFMVLEEMLRDERAEGKAEAVLIVLNELGCVSEELSEKIMNEKDLSVLTKYLKCAAKAESVEQFELEIR